MSSTHDLQIGDHVYSSSREQRGQIIETPHLIGGKPYYRIELVDGDRVTLAEKDLEPVGYPLERLATGKYGYASDFDLLTKAYSLFFAYNYGDLTCLSNSRLEPKPYQIFVAHRVLQDLYPRYLLADEVGLGKTIEAGLILKDLIARGVADRVLIVVPAGLREQWKGEMEVKFNERFYIYTGDTIRENLRRYPDRNPWTLDKKIIASLSFARLQMAQELEEDSSNGGIDDVDWDLVIFDEAHHLRRYSQGEIIDSKRKVTKSYRLGEALAEQTKSLLLLTAVPLQLSQYETYSLVELLDSSLFSSYGEFKISMSHRKAVSTIGKLTSKIGFMETWSEEEGEEVVKAFKFFFKEWFKHRRSEQGFWKELIRYCLQNVPQGHKERALRDAAHLRDSLWALQDDPGKIREAIVTFTEFIDRHREALRLWAARRHKLSRIMLRNRKREVLRGEMVERRAYRIPVTLKAAEQLLYDKVSNYIRESYARLSGRNRAIGLVLTTFRKLLVSSPYALADSLERRAYRIEQALESLTDDPISFTGDELEERTETLESVDQPEDLLSLTGGLSYEMAREDVAILRELADQARLVANPCDSKAKKLLTAVSAILESDPNEKVLIFTQFRGTQTYLQKLFEKEGYRVALFHGEYGDRRYSKRAEFRRFKRDPNVQVMLSTRVGGEGLNLQFCHILFNYDMPWNPMRIEQRIGRLDRIGQERDVHIYNFFLEGTLDARILAVLQDRIRLFEGTIGNLDPILGEEIENDISDIILSDEEGTDRKVEKWEKQIEERVREARVAEAKMADFILDARSFRRDTVDEILGRERPLDNRDIEDFTLAFLERYPHNAIKQQSDGIYKIIVPPRLREDCSELYGVDLREKYTGTFDPKKAIEEDTIDFFAFGHPLFDAIIRYCTADEIDNHFDAKVALRVLHHPDYRGYEGVQFNYVLTFEGVRTYKRLVPIVLNPNGGYDKTLSDVVFSSSSSVDVVDEEGRNNLPMSALQELEERSYSLVREITDQEIKKAQQRNIQDYNRRREKLVRLFDYRSQDYEKELKQRKARLADARKKGQERILPALKGQVKATQKRMEALKKQQRAKLNQLKRQRDVRASIELLNLAYVKIK
jgi:SNF2 family DNA or RNA helicase